VYVKSHDESRDFSEDSTAYANYKRRQSNTKKAMSINGDKNMSITVTGSMFASNTPNHSPAKIPKIAHTRAQHKQVTELIQETKGM
jgi:hypothetical protein